MLLTGRPPATVSLVGDTIRVQLQAALVLDVVEVTTTVHSTHSEIYALLLLMYTDLFLKTFFQTRTECREQSEGHH